MSSDYSVSPMAQGTKNRGWNNPMKDRIYIAGHAGMVGAAIMKSLIATCQCELITANKEDLDLRRQSDVEAFIQKERPDTVYLAAATVGGIHANNSFPSDFIYDNLMIQCNVIKACFDAGVKKLLFLGSSCIYPKFAKQPIQEHFLLSGPLEPTNEPYAIAKIAGLKMCESYNRQYSHSHDIDYRAVMPTNLYGPGDDFFSERNSHVVPALLKRFQKKKKNREQTVVIWGTGEVKREFLHVEDLAGACVKLMKTPKEKLPHNMFGVLQHINIGSGEEITIRSLAELISETVGFSGRIIFDSAMPEGTPRKFLDSKVLTELGWKPSISLRDGLSSTYKYLLSKEKIK